MIELIKVVINRAMYPKWFKFKVDDLTEIEEEF
jgi:hypothetical protein